MTCHSNARREGGGTLLLPSLFLMCLEFSPLREIFIAFLSGRLLLSRRKHRNPSCNQGYSQLGSAVRFCGCQTRKKQKLTNQASSKYISLPLAGGNCFICQFCLKLFCSSLLNTPQFELHFSQLRCLAGKRSETKS